MAHKLPIHGRDHAPTGSDPIEFPASDAALEWSNPICVDVISWAMNTNQTESSGWFQLTMDNTYPHGGYIQATLDAKYCAFVVNLGPAGSWWQIRPLLDIGSNRAKVTISIGTLSYRVGGTYDGALESNNNVTYVDVETIDLYSASPAIPYTTTATPTIKITGDVGDVGSALSFNATLGVYEWDGGPGPHRIKLRTNGANASSSGNTARLSGLSLWRVDLNGLP